MMARPANLRVCVGKVGQASGQITFGYRDAPDVFCGLGCDGVAGTNEPGALAGVICAAGGRFAASERRMRIEDTRIQLI